MATSKQPRKRLVIELRPEQHAGLAAQALRRGLSLANLVRRRLGIPTEIPRGRTDLRESRDSIPTKSAESPAN